MCKKLLGLYKLVNVDRKLTWLQDASRERSCVVTELLFLHSLALYTELIRQGGTDKPTDAQNGKNVLVTTAHGR